MPEPVNLELILVQIEKQEKEYDWLGAVEFYNNALVLVPKQHFLKLGEIHERLGYAFYRAAMQAESQEEFKSRMRQGVANYEKAKEFYGALSELTASARMLRCSAMNAYMGYWLSSEVSEKKKLLDECWRLTKESLEAFEKTGEAREYGRTYTQLSKGALLGFFLDWNYQIREETVKEAIAHGERAIAFLSTLGDAELIGAYVRTAACLVVFAYYFLDQDKKEECYRKARARFLRAKEISEETTFNELLSGFGWVPWPEGSDEALKNFEKALDYGRKTKDKFIVGSALDFLAHNTFWKASEDPDERIALAKRALQYAEKAAHEYSSISFISVCKGTIWVEASRAEYCFRLSSVETNLDKRRELLEKAVEALPELLQRAEDSGYPENVVYAHHVFRKVFTRLAEIEEDSEEKRGLLEKALAHGNESFRLAEQIETHNYWDLGIMQGGLAQIKYLLADLAKDPETKSNVVQAAVDDLETAGKLCTKGSAFYGAEAPVSQLAYLANWKYLAGAGLNRLYELTNKKEHLRKAAKVFEEAAETYEKVNLTSRVAECWWKAAQAHDTLGEHLVAAKHFDLASNNYRKAAEKILPLKDFYRDHTVYMQAWAEIEKARYHHRRQEHATAREQFDKAASLHKPLKQWGYLAPNYSAWSRVEYAEELSRNDRAEEAIQAFEQAAKLFNETKKSIGAQLSKIENPDEKHMATEMLKATGLRYDYCNARIALEEAKILDKKGDHYSSSEKYGSAADVLAKITETIDSEPERRELDLIMTLSRAWQKMTLAEAKASPALYIEASQLFEEAKDLGPDEKTVMLALGHSRFCRALEAGTRFVDTGDVTLHATAMQQLESAASYYLKAGFENAGEYAKATGFLFDAYLQIGNAKKEIDLEKKAREYTMAEKVLQTSAGFYMKAEHPEKREQVTKLIGRVREERELAVSLVEVLHAPSIVSTTSSFATPTPSHEEAVGSERFEHADIQANIIASRKELRVGENLDLEVELVNAGKGAALLTKLTEILPEGFELVEKPETYRVEDRSLNMKGKRLDPLKTEEVKLVLKPKVQGAFAIRPRILYLDENGKYRSHEPEPVNVTVKELGVRGWLKGER